MSRKLIFLLRIRYNQKVKVQYIYLKVLINSIKDNNSLNADEIALLYKRIKADVNGINGNNGIFEKSFGDVMHCCKDDISELQCLKMPDSEKKISFLEKGLMILKLNYEFLPT